MAEHFALARRCLPLLIGNVAGPLQFAQLDRRQFGKWLREQFRPAPPRLRIQWRRYFQDPQYRQAIAREYALMLHERERR